MIIRVCVCIPTFDNATTIEAVIAGCLTKTKFPILVLDDGSKVPVRDLLKTEPVFKALRSGRLEILRFERNGGKGLAIRAGIRHAVARAFTHLLTIDGDGQHLPEEIAKLTSIAEEDPWAVVIGSRELKGEHIPRSTRFGRAFSNFWVTRETNAKVIDSQSGFRLYPLFHLQGMRFLCRRYDFEIEILIRLAWKGVSIREVDIEVYYPPPAERVSHFHKLHDNVRISLLNTLLVAISLFRLHLGPGQIAIGLGIGVFVGCTPFFGFHTLIVGVIALLFRLNAAVLLLGSQISIPPLAPLLAYGSIQIGNRLKGTSGLGVGAWLEGSFVLGAALGTVVGLVAFAVALFARRAGNRRAANWTGKTRGGRFGNWFLSQVLRRCGLRAGYFCLAFIVPYFYFFAPKATWASLEYWRRVELDPGFFRRQWLVLRHYYRFGTVLMDRIYQTHFDAPQFVSSQMGFENIMAPLDNGSGVILLSAHAGAFDIAARYMKRAGLRESFHPIQYEAKAPTFTKLKGRKEQEGEHNLQTLFVNQGSYPILEIHRLLGEGKPIGMMGDRPVDRHFELVPFFGGLAAFDTTPFRVAATTGVPLLFTFGFKAGGRQYDFFAGPARGYRYEAGRDRELQCLKWVEEFARDAEQAVRRYRDQWFNFYLFWSSPPSAPETARRKAGKNPLYEDLLPPVHYRE